MGDQRQAVPILPPVKTRYPLYRRLGGLGGYSGRVSKISPPLGFDHQTVQLVASRYTDCAIPPHCDGLYYGKFVSDYTASSVRMQFSPTSQPWNLKSDSDVQFIYNIQLG